MKKATEAPTALIVTILAVVGIAIIVMLLFLMGQGVFEANTTAKYTAWDKIFSWG